jgi:zinc protease
MNMNTTKAWVLAFSIVITGANVMLAQESGLSLDTRPEPLEATPFTFPAYDEFTTKSGLHVYVVENHQVPTVTFSLIMRGGDAFDPPQKEGAAAMMADLLLKGTKGRTAQQIAESLDGVGASLNTNTSTQTITISGASLKKHSKLLFTILSEALTAPLFDEAEFSKMKEQYLASAANQRGSSNEMAQALARKVIYGMNNPVARRQTEASIKNIERKDLLDAFKQYVMPNNASIAVVGDVTMAEVQKMLDEHFKTWSKGTQPKTDIPKASVEPAGVYFVHRPGSVQSTVLVCSSAPGYESAEWLPVDVAMSYMGGGFGSRLYNTLRETHSYTYSPFGFVTRGRDNNRIALGAEVRNSVTDSALNVILDEIRTLGAEGPDPDVLARFIKQEVGQYRLLFERASTVGTLLQNVWTVGVPVEFVTKHDERLEGVSFGDVKEAASKYMGMFDLRIIVVGSPDIRSKLEPFGSIKEFDTDLKPIVVASYEKVSMSMEEIIEGYAKALGGRDAINKVKTVLMNGTASMTMQGRTMKGTITRKLMAPNKEISEVDLKVMKQTQWVDGQSAWVSMNGGPANSADPDETRSMVTDARTFHVLSWKEDGYELVETGKRGESLEVKLKNPSGRPETYIFHAPSMMLKRVEREEETPQGPIVNITKYEGYKDIGGVKFPTTVITQNPIYSLEYSWDVKVNEGVSEEDFRPSNN